MRTKEYIPVKTVGVPPRMNNHCQPASPHRPFKKDMPYAMTLEILPTNIVTESNSAIRSDRWSAEYQNDKWYMIAGMPPALVIPSTKRHATRAAKLVVAAWHIVRVPQQQMRKPIHLLGLKVFRRRGE